MLKSIQALQHRKYSLTRKPGAFLVLPPVIGEYQNLVKSRILSKEVSSYELDKLSSQRAAVAPCLRLAEAL